MSARARLAAAIAGPALLALVLAGAPRAAAADAALSYGCSPPLPRTPANCSIWHTGPVTLVWSYGVDFEPAPVQGSDCDKQIIKSDTTGTSVMCAVWDTSGNNLTNGTATVRVDMTPPSVTGMTPSRPPDHDGWWNHPVSLAFGGADATSGIAGCDTVDYSGPDSATVQVTGSCRDAAGNAATGAFDFKYDATPPTITPVSSDARNAHVTLKWDTSPDSVLTRILRSPGIGGAPVTEVFSGVDKAYTDPGVHDGDTYTYTLITADAAANAVSAVMVVTPPKKLVRLRPPVLRWRRVKDADYYNVQVYRGRRKILSAWPRGTKLRIRNKWTFRGRRRKLTAGRYDWYVWPGFGRRSAHRYGRVIVHRRFTIKPTPS